MFNWIPGSYSLKDDNLFVIFLWNEILQQLFEMVSEQLPPRKIAPLLGLGFGLGLGLGLGLEGNFPWGQFS